MRPTVPKGWYSTLNLAPKKLSIFGETSLLDGFIHFFIFFLAILSDVMEEATSASNELVLLHD